MKSLSVTCLAAITLAGGLAACSTPASGSDATSTSIADSCINPTRIEKQAILSDQEIQFTLNNGEVWLNRLPRACPSLKFQGGFTWDVRGTLVCSNEQTIYVREDGTPCQLGVFTRLSTPT